MTDFEAPKVKMKYKSLFFFVVSGGAAGFAVHLFWHYRLDVELISIAPHIFLGVVYTAVGMAVGLLVWYLFKRKY